MRASLVTCHPYFTFQVHRDPDSQIILEEWKKERKELR